MDQGETSSHDSWLQSVMGVDLSKYADGAKAAVSRAADTVESTVETVGKDLGEVTGAGSAAVKTAAGGAEKVLDDMKNTASTVLGKVSSGDLDVGGDLTTMGKD